MRFRLRRNCQIMAAILVAAMVVCFYIQYLTTSAYNEKPRVSTGVSSAKDCSAIIAPRVDKESSWHKEDVGLTGQMFDVIICNKTSDVVSSWTMTIDIEDNCYLNQVENGRVEIHQHVREGKEAVQTLGLSDYNPNSLEVDYHMEGSEPLIPLENGDYIVYYPEKGAGEMTLNPASQTVVGMVFYYRDGMDLANYRVDYYCQRGFTKGIPFILFVVFGALLALTLIAYPIALHSYDQAENEFELRQSGQSFMSELYAVIYLIDLNANTIVSGRVDEDPDEIGWKDLTPNVRLKNMIQTDAKPAFKGIGLNFVDLNTIRERMENHNSIAFEYESNSSGWCRIRFSAIGRDKQGELEKVLFTMEHIDGQKRELSAILTQAIEAKSSAEEQGALQDKMLQELQESFDKTMGADELILGEGAQEALFDHAQLMRETEGKLRWLMRNALDYSRIKANKVEVSPSDYALKNLVLGARHHAWSMLGEKAPGFQVELTPALPRGLYGDEAKLRQVIVNLLLIAADRAIGVKLSVFGKVAEEGTLHMLVSVLAEQGKDESQAERDDDGSVICMVATRAILELLGSRLNVTDAYGGDINLYFEIDQRVVDRTPVGLLDEDGAEGSVR